MKPVFVAFLVSTVLLAQDRRDLDTVITSRIENAPATPSLERGQGVGVVVGVLTATGRNVVSYGRLALDRTQKPTAETIFEIGSITKVFTALLLADMVERGEVKLDDPVAKFLPVTVTVPSRNGKQITLADLVTHTSGLPFIPSNVDTTSPDNPFANYTPTKLYEFLSSYVLAHDPGERYDYSNLSGGLLGTALALKAGMSYEELVRRRITEPLGLRDTTITLSDEQKRRIATGHDLGLHPVGLWDWNALQGAGAIRSTASDLLTFAAANLGLMDTPLNAAMRRMRDFRRPNGQRDQEQAMGWQVFTRYAPEIVLHDGGTHGFRSCLAIQPTTGRAVVVLANSQVQVRDVALHTLEPRYGVPELSSSNAAPVVK
jgi:serine-type D-Ala-D-Ala carboxypeptidase/endopeptidase